MFEAYILLQDLHLALKKANRFNYSEECYAVLNFIHTLADKYRNLQCNKVSGISLGDLSDRGYNTRKEYSGVTQMIKWLIKAFDDFYLNFGNHEITYCKDNPVYHFIRDIQNKAIRTAHSKIVCESKINEILTPERLEFEDFEILFQGWNTYLTPNLKKQSFLLLHQTMLTQASLSAVRAELQYEEHNYNQDFTGIQKVYAGHSHTVIERWHINDTEIINLGSLLRTNVNEVSDLNLRRHIPVILVEDGYLSKIIYEPLDLHKRALIIDEDSLKRGQEANREYAFQHKVKERALAPSLELGNPIDNLTSRIKSQGDDNLMTLFEELRRKV